MIRDNEKMNKNLKTIGLDERRIHILHELLDKVSDVLPIGHRVTLLLTEEDGRHSRILEEIYPTSLPPKYLLHYSGYFVYVTFEQMDGKIKKNLSLYYRSHSQQNFKIGSFYTSIEHDFCIKREVVDSSIEDIMRKFDPFYSQNSAV